jgi:ABC-type lipoprotein export system ATPase subunit
MLSHVTKVKAVGVYGRFDLEQEFQPGVNIIYGKNGTGKTTFLHILANVLNADYKRFVYLLFKSVEVVLNDGRVVVVTREPTEGDSRISVTIDQMPIWSFAESEVKLDARRRLLRQPQAHLFEERSEEKKGVEPLLPADYFPAFRTMIEAWSSIQEDSVRQRPQERQRKATHLARELFGKFVPQINYPSPVEIEQRLVGEVTEALYSLSISDQELLSRALLDIFGALFSEKSTTKETAEMMLDQIKTLSESLEASPMPGGWFVTPTGIYDELRQSIAKLRVRGAVEQSVIRILGVYRATLAKRFNVQRAAFVGINKYLDAVNEFLDGKKLVTLLKGERVRSEEIIKIVFSDGHIAGWETLSSGERQIVTLIYAATHMNKQRVVLIDEPELSLHVDWQRMLLSKMSEQLQDRQIIACTHSPVIAADYKDHLKELTLAQSEVTMRSSSGENI